MTPADLKALSDMLHKVVADMEESLYNRVEGAAKHFVRQVIQDDMHDILRKTVQDMVDTHVVITVESKDAIKG